MLRWIALGLTSLTLVFGAGAFAAERQVPASPAAVQLSFAPVVQQVMPAVVNVFASRTIQQQAPRFFFDPFHFFDDPGAAPIARKQNFVGSGVIVDPSGLVVTNFHVIADADEIRVALSDKREFPAKIVLKDRRSDLAVLKISVAGGNLPTIGFANSDKVAVGDLVLAIGDPFGVGQTVTSGIVSAFAHDMSSDQSENQYFIQTDASINPGNSGGALVDINGQLVGINRAIVTPSGGSTGIGFAIPSNLVRAVVSAAIAGRAPVQPWLGATLQSVTPQIAEAKGLRVPEGVLVADVAPGGPAAAAHLQSDDLITAIDGEPVSGVGVLNYRLAIRGVGGTAKLNVMRDGKPYDATVALEAPPETVPRAETTISGSSPVAGATVLNLSPAVADEMHYGGPPSGVIVSDVSDNSRAAANDIRPGDIIVSLNNVPITTTHELALVAGQQTNYWDLIIDRGGRSLRLQMRS